MPNWVEGTFRARGIKENVVRFIEKGLTGLNPEKSGFKRDDVMTDTYKATTAGLIWIEGTRRHFLNAENRDYLCLHETKNNEYQFEFPFIAAWAIDTGSLVEIAKIYSIDIRVNGFECGMEFEQLVEIRRDGFIRTESVIQYEDYEWECAMPLMGG